MAEKDGALKMTPKLHGTQKPHDPIVKPKAKPLPKVKAYSKAQMGLNQIPPKTMPKKKEGDTKPPEPDHPPKGYQYGGYWKPPEPEHPPPGWPNHKWKPPEPDHPPPRMAEEHVMRTTKKITNTPMLTLKAD